MTQLMRQRFLLRASMLATMIAAVGIAGAQRLGTASAITIMFLPFFLILIFILTRHMLREEV